MKKVAIIANLAGIGGTEKSLVNLLEKLPPNCCRLTVLVVGSMGPLTDEIPDWIQVRKVASHDSKCLIKKYIRRHRLDLAVPLVWNRLRSVVLRRMYKETSMYQYQLVTEFYEKIHNPYDIAITWSLPNSLHTVYTLKNVTAKKKALWIHMDVSVDKPPKDAGKYFVCYNDIFCVSKHCKASFDRCFPECADKTRVFYNILDKQKIMELSKQNENLHDEAVDVLKIVTCGRISGPKQPLLAVKVAEELVRKGITGFKWYFIGNGDLQEKLQDAITEKHLDKYFGLLGEQRNPYTYVARGDVYVQMSRHESFCLTLSEAQILSVPAISTNFGSAYEIIEPGVSGFIVENDWEAIYRRLEDLILNKDKLEMLRSNMRHYCFRSNGNIEHFLAYIEE